MSKIVDSEALLRACIQDLAAGKQLLVRHVPSLKKHVTEPVLRGLVAEIATTADAQATRLRATGLAEGGPTNLWMTGILDDAARDTRTTAPGPLLDLALIGALRKARAAEIVSADTAIALADAMSWADVREEVVVIRAAEQTSDLALAARLDPLAQAAASLPPCRHGGIGGMVVGGGVALAAASLASWMYWARQDRRRENARASG